MHLPKYNHQINIVAESKPLYKDLMNQLGWSIALEDRNMIGFTDPKNGDLWFVDSQKKQLRPSDNQVKHVKIFVSQKEDVDRAKLFLDKRKVKALFGTPKFRPELARSKDEVYYQLTFESPEKIQFEIVFTGDK